MAPISLKMISIEKPMILNGSNSNQINGKRKINNNASGQQRIKRINQRKIAISVFIIRDCIQMTQKTHQS